LEKAREEVLSKVPDGPLTMDRLDGLEFLERLSREIRRYYAMNSATFFATVKEPVDVMGYHIPAGWGAMAAIHITMRNPVVFDQPERFDPDRFLAEPMASRAPGSYVPHGGGPKTGHKCPAEDLVAVTIKVYLTLMLRRYHWELPPQDLTLENDLFPLPKSGVQLRFYPHTPKPQNQESKVGASLGR
jgi:cytochrome P450